VRRSLRSYSRGESTDEVIVRAITIVMLIAGASSPAWAHSTPSWILWEKTYATKKGTAPTTMWEPYDGYDSLAECRKAAQPLLQAALAYVKSTNGKVLGLPKELEGRAAVFTITESGVEQTTDLRFLCFPGPFDPRPRS
jgi:hypothetical protein